MESNLDEYAEKAPRSVSCMEAGFDDAMAVMALPELYRRRLRSTNGLERLNREVRRRERVIGIFPNIDSAMRLLGALLMEQDEESREIDGELHGLMPVIRRESGHSSPAIGISGVNWVFLIPVKGKPDVLGPKPSAIARRRGINPRRRVLVARWRGIHSASIGSRVSRSGSCPPCTEPALRVQDSPSEPRPWKSLDRPIPTFDLNATCPSPSAALWEFTLLGRRSRRKRN